MLLSTRAGGLTTRTNLETVRRRTRGTTFVTWKKSRIQKHRETCSLQKAPILRKLKNLENSRLLPLMKNSPAFVELAFAVSHLGAVLLPVNFRLAITCDASRLRALTSSRSAVERPFADLSPRAPFVDVAS